MESTAVQTPTNTDKGLPPKVFRESKQRPDILHSSSKPVIPPKNLPKSRLKLIPSRSFSKPVPPPKPDTRSTLVQPDSKSIDIVSKKMPKTAQCRRSKGATLLSRLKGLEPHLKTELAIKVTSVSLMYSNKPADSLRMSSQILLQECYRMKKETVARNVEANVELEQLRENVGKNSAVASLNEVYRSKLHSMEQELISERFQSNEDRMHFEEKIEKLKADIYNEKAKCRRLDEEKLLSKSVIMKMEERLRKSDHFYKQQIQELKARLAISEYERQTTKDAFELCNSEMTLLRTESEELNGVTEIGEMLTKEKETRIELEMQLDQAQEHCSDLLERLKENEKSLQMAEKEKLDLIETQRSTMEERSIERDLTIKLQEELEIEKHQRKELDDRLRLATERLEHVNRKPEGLFITSVNQGSRVIKSNYQFLLENIVSDRLINVLHEKNCLTNEERHHLNNQPNNFYRNDALLHWMRMISFDQDIGLKVLECLREANLNFIVDLLQKGGVLIKSKISTNLVKGGQPFSLIAKSSRIEALKRKETAIVGKLNKEPSQSFSMSQSTTTETAEDDIIIVPYCHQEENGIVIWFWCRSKTAQRNLQSMYSSNVLIEKLIPIFKQNSQDSISSVKEILVPTSITIFLTDFTKNKKVVDFKTESKLLQTVRTKAAKKSKAKVYALAILTDEIFVVTEKNSEVEVYNRTRLHFERSFTVDNLEEPRDIVSCFRSNCLYIIDGKPLGQPMEILRVDINGNIVKKIWRGNDWGRLSVTDESNIILAVRDKDKLLEITPYGRLVRNIALEVSKPWHAVKLSNDSFVVCYSWSKKGGICIVDCNGDLLISSTDKVVHSLSIFLPINVVVVNGGESFLLVNEDGGQILQLTSTLEYQRKFLSKKHGLRHPRRIFVDELKGRLLVCDNLANGGCILVFDISG